MSGPHLILKSREFIDCFPLLSFSFLEISPLFIFFFIENIFSFNSLSSLSYEYKATEFLLIMKLITTTLHEFSLNPNTFCFKNSHRNF